jgi:hypothetical protein
MARWRIIDGPNEPPNPRAVDGVLWGFVIENANDPAQRRHVVVVISRSALSSSGASLPVDVTDAIHSNGQTALERYLDDPPARVMVSSTSIAPSSDES